MPAAIRSKSLSRTAVIQGAHHLRSDLPSLADLLPTIGGEATPGQRARLERVLPAALARAIDDLAAAVQVDNTQVLLAGWVLTLTRLQGGDSARIARTGTSQALQFDVTPASSVR